jgi:plasmid stabilization system protein ParE
MTREFTVYWSPEAEETYLETIKFILERWPVEVAEDFERLVEDLVNRLRQHKNLCPSSPMHKQLRKCMISGQTSLIYRINGDEIELVAFIDNRSNHNY